MTTEQRGSKLSLRISRIFKCNTLEKSSDVEELDMVCSEGWEKRTTLQGHCFYLEVGTGRVQWDKPDVLKTDTELAESKAEWVWIPHPMNVWQPAHITSRDKAGVSVMTLDNCLVTIPHIGMMKGKLTDGVAQKVPLWPLERKALDNIEDNLMALPSLNEGIILYNLRLRYESSIVYTWVGSSRCVLISINPFQDLELNTPKVIEEQRIGHNAAEKIGKTLAPHVFGIANDSLDALMFENKSQAILISGESGAGKTHATKQCLDFLATVASSCTSDNRERRRFEMMAMTSGTSIGVKNKVEQKVLVANPVLEAFGNAMTVRNNNSSRFGKWVAVFFDRRSKQINGAQITTFLLERSRVALQAQWERNYHIFYQLLHDEDVCERYGLAANGAEKYRYTNQSGCVAIDEVDDKEGFVAVIDALEKLGVDDEEQEWLVRTVAAVLHLGNVAFAEVAQGQNHSKKVVRIAREEDTPIAEISSTQSGSGGINKTKGKKRALLTTKAARIQSAQLVTEENLGSANVKDGANNVDDDCNDSAGEAQMRKMRGGGGGYNDDGCGEGDAAKDDQSHAADRSEAQIALEQCAELLEIEASALEKVLTQRSITVRNETNYIPLTSSAALKARDSLAKAVYARMFDWLVQRINSAFGNVEGRFIGILDIFGFEILEHNSFEQLCINYANEQLQKLFNQHTFSDEMELYELEKVPYPKIKFQDNRPVLDIISKKPNGILHLLDDECVVPGGSDKRLMTRVDGIFQNNKFFMSIGAGKSVNANVARSDEDKLCFSIKHFAGSVTYDMTGFVIKNADTLFQDLYEVCSKSTDYLTAELFPTLEDDEYVKVVSQSGKFRAQLSDLIQVLDKTGSRYIRCIKPNEKQGPKLFEGRKCLEQLRSSGVFEAVDIRKTGFPFRLMHEEFARRYRCINQGYVYRNSNESDQGVRALCLEIIEVSPQRFEGVRIGELRVLYRVEDHRMLELLRELALGAGVPRVQAAWRAALARRFRLKMKKADDALTDAMGAKEPSVSELETAIDEVPDILGSLGDIFCIDPPSLSKAKRMFSGLEHWENVEEDLEKYENCNDMKELPMGVLDEADRLRGEGFPMTEQQTALYDHIKQLIIGKDIAIGKRKSIEEATNTKIRTLSINAKEMLEEPSLSRNKVDTVIKEANVFATSSPELDKAKDMAERFHKLDEDATRAVEMVDRTLLEQVKNEALKVGNENQIIRQVNMLLSLDERSFVVKEFNSARKWNDNKRKTHRELRLREIDLANCFLDYLDFFGFKQVRDGMSMLSAEKDRRTALLDMIRAKRDVNGGNPNLFGIDPHSQPLSQFAERVMAASIANNSSTLPDVEKNRNDGNKPVAAAPDPELHQWRHTMQLNNPVLKTVCSKTDINLALETFENIKLYMGDSQHNPVSPDVRNVAGLSVIHTGLDNEILRNEILAQLVMQLTDNHSDDSIKAGIDLLCLVTVAFPPNKEPFENHFAVWIKLHLPDDFYRTLMSTLHHHRLSNDANGMHMRLSNLLHVDSSAFQDEGRKGSDAPWTMSFSVNNDEDIDADSAVSGKFEEMRAQHALEALRSQFKAFFENGSRHSLLNVWEKDPWSQNLLFEGMRRPVLPTGTFKVKDLCGYSSNDGDNSVDAHIAGTEVHLEASFEKESSLGTASRSTGLTFGTLWNKPRMRPLTRSNTVFKMDESNKKELVTQKINNFGSVLRSLLLFKKNKTSSKEQCNSDAADGDMSELM